MDPRHQSSDEYIFNEIIAAVNHYITDHVDYLCDMRNKKIRRYIKQVCQSVYEYAGVSVDIDAILAKKNLLSIDVVLFPYVRDEDFTKKHDHRMYMQVVRQIIKLAEFMRFKKPINLELKNKITMCVKYDNHSLRL